MLVHIYIYEYIFPLLPLWLDLKIERNYHYEGGKILCYSWGKLVLTLSERKKKRQHILTQTPLVTAFVTRKQDFFFSPLAFPISHPASLLSCILQHLQDKIAKLRGQSRFIIVMQKKLKCNP